MRRYISCPLRPYFYTSDSLSKDGYLSIPLTGARQLRVLDRLTSGSRKDRTSVYVQSGHDLEEFSRTVFERTGYTVVNGTTKEPVIPGEFDSLKTVSYITVPSMSQIEAILKMKDAAPKRRFCPPGTKLPISERHKFTFYSDPGHGWLAVSMDLIFALGIERDITPFSYRNGETAYLEEDSDMSTFINALRSRDFPFDINKSTEYKHINDSSDGNFIRRQASFYI